MSTNDKIEDAVTRHQVFIMRYSKGREDVAERHVQEIMDKVESILGPDIASASPAILDRIVQEIIDEMKQASEAYEKSFIDEMKEFVGFQSDFNVDLMDINIDASDVVGPALAVLQAAMLLRRMPLEPTRSYTINEALKEYSARKSRQVVQMVRDGVTLGQTSQEISANVKNLTQLQKRQAATLARTVTNYVSIQAREVFMRENKKIIDRYRWIATLDGRTSLICAGRDQQIYKDTNDSPKPPAHFNCRSTITPMVKEEFDLGLNVVGKRAAVNDKGTTRVSGDTAYGSWLRRQSKAFQVEVLGVARAKLFRDGKISIGRFVDAQGKTLTLAELRKLQPMVFQDLGI
ncbi:MAG: minor capsid protein [Rhodospirillales bacterium]|jgi:SPP1 gp7 family putative phage head morphogenesis protein|tara:strand:+ start:769 stop:1809 length:1041 start_codon:yes stop_codon:yes gene_type:complete